MWLIKHQHYNNYCDKTHQLSLSLSIMAATSISVCQFAVWSVCLFVVSWICQSAVIANQKKPRSWARDVRGCPPSENKWDACEISWNLASILIRNPCCQLALSSYTKLVSSKDFLEVKYFNLRNILYFSICTCRNNEKDLSISNCNSENLLNSK